MSAQSDDSLDPFVRSDADFQRRLINFPTGKSELTPGHMRWLDTLLKSTPATREFHCIVYGYASKLGDAAANERLSYDRANNVIRYLETRDPKYTTRTELYRAFGENDPSYKAGESDNDPAWRAVEVHCKFDKPPIIKPGSLKVPRKPAPTHMKWSVSGYFQLTASVVQVAQFGIALFKFRDDETGVVRTYLVPITGVGYSFDVTKVLSFLKGLGDKKLPAAEHLAHAVDKILANPALLANPFAALKEIGRAILTGTGLSDWTDFTKCEVYQPLTHAKLDGQTLANVAATGGAYQVQKIWVYGKVWYTDLNGKKMFGTKDLLAANSSGWVAQVPALSAGAVGGPLILL